MKDILATCLTSTHTSFSAAPTFIKITSFSLLFLSLFFLIKHFPVNNTIQSNTQEFHLSVNPTTPTTRSPPSSPSPSSLLVIQRTGILDENGVMSDNFTVGEFDESLLESEKNGNKIEKREKNVVSKIKIEKFKFCDESMSEYIPCLDNFEAIKGLNLSNRGEKFERHCPEKGKGLNCMVPKPKGYKHHVPWPKSRDEVLFDNVPRTRLVKDKGGQRWVERKNKKLIFPIGGIPFTPGVDQYLDQIAKMVPEIAFGKHTRVALDIGCGVANFGAYLMSRNVTTLSIAPKDVNENQIQIALERGVPAMVAAFATRCLSYPSQAFDLVHCSHCEINWIRDDGIYLLEVNRILRGGGYFVWSDEPVYKQEPNFVEQWKYMENLAHSLCWELVKREGYIAVWKKPQNNNCYLSTNRGVKPSLCDKDDNPDDIWYADLKKCITRLPEEGYGTKVATWPERLYDPPDRLVSVKIDAYTSQKQIYIAEWKFWEAVVEGYVHIFHWRDVKIRNVMDMKAGYGGFAAAINHFQLDWWVMNVIPISGFNTLPVIYDRGFVGVLHDWCEPFDTYPRTYDMLNAAGLFTAERNRCNMSTIMLEMDRILRPGGRVYIRETKAISEELTEIAKAMGWVIHTIDTYEGAHASWLLSYCSKPE